MIMHAKVNLKSVHKYPGVRVSAQVTTSDADDNQAFYACQITPDGFDRDNIYQFADSKWCKVSLTDELIDVIAGSLNYLLSKVGHAFNRKTKDSKGRDCLIMYRDAVISVASKFGKHHIKIGDRLFETHSAQDLFPNGVEGERLTFIILGAPNPPQVMDLSLEPEIKARLQKQFDVARAKYMRVVSSQPIGGMSWAANQNSRKEFGRSNYNHRQLQRSRS